MSNLTFFKDAETTKKYITFLRDVIRNKSKTSTNLIEQIKIQKELLLLGINVTTILKMDNNEAVNYIMHIIGAKHAKSVAEQVEVSDKIASIIESESRADVREADSKLMSVIGISDNKPVELDIDEALSNIDLEQTRKSIFSTPPAPIEEVLGVDSDAYEAERAILRDSLFNKKVTIHITKSGKNFQYRWNVSMTDVVVKIPTTWEIEIDQSLLLELYTREFNTLNTNESPDIIKKLSSTLAINSADISLCDDTNVIESVKKQNIEKPIITETADITDKDCNFVENKNKKRNKRVDIKNVKDFSNAEIIEMFKERENITATIDSYTSVRSLIKRALNISYSEATERIINALSTVDDDDIISFGINNTSHLYRNIMKVKNGA